MPPEPPNANDLIGTSQGTPSSAALPGGAASPPGPDGSPGPAGASSPGAGGAGGGGLLERLAGFGLDVSGFQNDDEALAHLLAAQMQVPELERLAAFGQQVLPYVNEFQEFLKSRQSSQEPQAGAAAASKEPQPEPYWPAPPEWKPEYEQFLTIDPRTGQVVATDPVFAHLVPKYHEYIRWKRERDQAFWRDPVAAIWKGIEQRLEEREKQRGFLTKQDLDAYRQQQFANSFAVANEDWLYAKDPVTGQPIVNAAGQRQLSLAGQFYVHNIQRLEQLAQRMAQGDPTAQHELAQFALEMTIPAFLQAGAVGGGPPQSQGNGAAPPPQDPRDAYLQAHLYSPNRAGSFPTSATGNVPQNTKASFPTLLRQRAREAGLVSE